MADIILVDTDLLVDVARGMKMTASFLDEKKVHHVLAISSVTEMELIVGCRNKDELANLELFLSGYERFKIDATINTFASYLI